MNSFKLIPVHDWYDRTRSTYIRCEYASGIYCCSKRQKREATRRARVMPGSALRSDTVEIFVFDVDGRFCDSIKGC